MTGSLTPDGRYTRGSEPTYSEVEQGDKQESGRTAGSAGNESPTNFDAEVRTALQSIVGAAYLLHCTPLTAEQREYVDYVSSAAVVLEKAMTRATSELAELACIASNRSSTSVQKILATAREVLGMDVAFVSRFTEERMMFRALEGDARSFGWREGEGLPLAGTFCKRLVEGTLPSVIPDTRNDERVNRLDMMREADIGSYVGVPLRFSDGRVYGTLCCLSHISNPRLQEQDARFMHVLARLAADQLEHEELEAENREPELGSTRVDALLAALGAHDGYTEAHARAVVECSMAMARRMGLSEEEVAEVEQAAALHDIGKIGIAEAILQEPGPLSDAEREVVRAHAVKGANIVSATRGLSHLAPVVRAVHERWDGGGYPDGLSGEEIPLASRIISVCDAFHAMTSDRPYRRALDARSALAELRGNAGAQFCPRTVRAFLDTAGQTGAPGDHTTDKDEHAG
jgi:HD-GYP domain-containing protein (c-di-GMP phosphodiesterase class II)